MKMPPVVGYGYFLESIILVLIHILIISVKLECMYFIHCLS